MDAILLVPVELDDDELDAVAGGVFDALGANSEVNAIGIVAANTISNSFNG